MISWSGLHIHSQEQLGLVVQDDLNKMTRVMCGTRQIEEKHSIPSYSDIDLLFRVSAGDLRLKTEPSPISVRKYLFRQHDYEHG